jgi:hypothetical protein
MPALSATRVPENTPPALNERIQRRTRVRLAYYAAHPNEIDYRLKELDKEWDIERMLEAGSSTVTLLALIFGIARHRKWFLLALIVQGFFLQHAIQGWCPPLPMLRRLGFRTPYEIEEERGALKALRGESEKHKGDRAKGNSASRS